MKCIHLIKGFVHSINESYPSMLCLICPTRLASASAALSLNNRTKKQLNHRCVFLLEMF